MNKNLLLQPSLIEQLDNNLDGEDFKDFVIKLYDYSVNGVLPNFDGVKKVLFEMSKPYYDYLSSKWEDYSVKRAEQSLGVETYDKFIGRVNK